MLITTISTDGYYRVNAIIGGIKQAVLVHRIAYELYHSELLLDYVIDHIDQNKLNNSISNLRKVTRAENNRNLGKRITNTSGHSGVYQSPSGRWVAQIRVNGKNNHLGCFDTLEEAADAKSKANIYYGFHENHN